MTEKQYTPGELLEILESLAVRVEAFMGVRTLLRGLNELVGQEAALRARKDTLEKEVVVADEQAKQARAAAESAMAASKDAVEACQSMVENAKRDHKAVMYQLQQEFNEKHSALSETYTKAATAEHDNYLKKKEEMSRDLDRLTVECQKTIKSYEADIEKYASQKQQLEQAIARYKQELSVLLKG